MKRSLFSLLIVFMLSAPASVFASPLQEQALPHETDWISIPAHFMQSEAPAVNNMVQVFDVAKGRVVHSLANNADFQKTAEQWLSKITSLAPEVHPDMKATYIVRVPVEPAKPLDVGDVHLSVKEIFVFYYADTSKEPLLLIFDENKKPFFFHIHEDITPFIKSLNIPE